MQGSSDYDVIVMGGGSPGEHCVGALVEGGLRVALVERELVGGECSYWACIPSKTLLRPGEAVRAAQEAAGKAEVDVAAALAWCDFMVSNYSDAGQQRWLADRGVTLLRGRGRLAGSGIVEVDGVRHRADHVILATGADPIVPPVPGLRELEGIWTNREVTAMKAIPRHLLILGGGPVGVEMAQAVRRLGGAATIVEGAPRVLPHEAASLGDALGDALRGEGIDLMLGIRARAATLIAKVKPGGVFATVLGVPGGAANYPSVKVVPVFSKFDRKTLEFMAEAVRDGKLLIPIGDKLPLRDAAKAQAITEKGGAGKILLLP